MTTPRLKPCPFCGKQPKFYSESRFSGGQRYFMVNCVDKKCLIGPMTGWDSEDAVIAAWNRRAKKER